tara:strand:- start:44865 stop:47324 length:2460 start_codon:yes stop_codon:yes gene_type:complete
MKKITLLTLLLFCNSTFSQVTGRITDTKQNPLSFVSVYLDKTFTGTTSNENGYYELDIKKPGDYVIVFQFLGYKIVKKPVSIDDFPFQVNVVLEDEKVILDEISIATSENPANKIIRSTINNKEKNTNTYKEFTANFYSRGLFKVKDAPEKILGQSIGDLGGGLDSTRTGIIYLSETVSTITYQKKPQNFKEKIIASKVSGSDNGISFNRAEEANFDFYSNLVTVAESNIVSPVSDRAFAYYKFKLEGSFYGKNGRFINKIKVIPKRDGDRVFSGFIYIVEDDWAIYGVDLIATGKQVGIPVIDVLKFKQNYNYSEINNAWIKISQTIDFKFGFLGFNVDGRFSAAYSDYNFSPNFKKGTFTREVLSFENGATEKDSLFWNQLRPVPLTIEETKDYTLKDNIKLIRKSKKYLDSIDKKGNTFNPLSMVMGYTFRNSYRKWSISFDSPLNSIAYNTVQGWNASTSISYFNRLNNKGKWINTSVNVNYGSSEKKIRPVFYFNKKWNNLDKPRLSISGGITTSQFNNSNPISRRNNTIYSLLGKENYLKIYEKTFGKVNYSQEVTNGIYINSSLEYANRRPLYNTTSYLIFGRNIAFQSNNPLDPSDFTAPFTEHKIATLNIGANFVISQNYLSYPNRKFSLGNSKHPSLSVNYRKNFGANNSDFNSDLFIANIRQFISLGNRGDFRYNVRSGIFLQQNNIPFMDYLHANGNQLNLASANRISSFGLLDYYQFSSNNKYAEVHLEHNFKGYLLSKIPLINKLNFHLVVEAKGLFTNGKKPYSEYSVGLDNIGFGKWRFLRIDYVRSTFNGNNKDGFLFGIAF